MNDIDAAKGIQRDFNAIEQIRRDALVNFSVQCQAFSKKIEVEKGNWSIYQHKCF